MLLDVLEEELELLLNVLEELEEELLEEVELDVLLELLEEDELVDAVATLRLRFIIPVFQHSGVVEALIVEVDVAVVSFLMP